MNQIESLLGRTAILQYAELMEWYWDQDFLLALQNSSERQNWEDIAKQRFYTVKKRFPRELAEPNRVGTLLIAEIPGAEGLNCWISPVEGHKKILGPKNEIKLIGLEGNILFQGMLGNLEKSWLEANVEFYVWFKPPSENAPRKIPWTKRIEGAFRYWKYKK